MTSVVRLPLDDERARELRVGQQVLVSGLVVTGRAAARRRLLERDHPALRARVKGGLLFHCTPLVQHEAGGWRVVACAPASSTREEPYAAQLMERYGLRGFVGRGGLGVHTLAALALHGGVYLHTSTELAVALARSVRRVEAVHLFKELGPAEAVWCLQVQDLPAIVSMDAHGQSLHALGGDRSVPLDENAAV